MKLGEFDRSGRRKPVPIEGSEYTLSIDTIIPAISQSADTSFIPAESDVKKDKWGGIEITNRAKNRTTAENVFIIGDAATGPATVVEAIAMGHRVAEDVDGWIRAKNNEPAYKAPAERRSTSPFEVDEDVVETPKASHAGARVSKRVKNFKRSSWLQQGHGIQGACRCLRCDAEI